MLNNFKRGKFYLPRRRNVEQIYYLCSTNFNYCVMDFDDMSVPVDAECYGQDIDDVDLFGELLVEEEDSDIQFE